MVEMKNIIYSILFGIAFAGITLFLSWIFRDDIKWIFSSLKLTLFFGASIFAVSASYYRYLVIYDEDLENQRKDADRINSKINK